MKSDVNGFGIGAETAWAQGKTGSPTVYVGLIDEGSQWFHEDLLANMFVNPGEIPGNGIDDDGNGYIDDVRGWDFFNNDASTYDGLEDDHGTHVAGTMGAVGSNGKGVAGVNWNVKIINAKFLGPSGGYLSGAISALYYLIDLKTRHNLNLVAINNSWSGGGYTQAMADAISQAGLKNILFVAAAGNSAVDTDVPSQAAYPACYPQDNVISVAATFSGGGLAWFTNFGATTVDIAAPGEGIMSTLPDNAYGSYSGTSMAAPHVTGACALYAALNPGATAAQIKAAILNSTKPEPWLQGKCVTGGRLRVSAY
jgi:subtilisin family serine protease